MRLLRRLGRWLVDVLSVECADGLPLWLHGPGGDFTAAYYPRDFGVCGRRFKTCATKPGARQTKETDDGHQAMDAEA